MAEITTPDWVKDAIFYQIFPDRFARSGSALTSPYLQPWGAAPTYEGFQGGDLLGITEKLDYLLELGVNALYLSPIFQSATNHRYGHAQLLHGRSDPRRQRGLSPAPGCRPRPRDAHYLGWGV